MVMLSPKKYMFASALVALTSCASPPPTKKSLPPVSKPATCLGSGTNSNTYLLATASKDYVADAKLILDANCLGGCHRTGGTGAAAAVLDTYAGVKAVDATKFKSSYQTAAVNRMPKGGTELGIIQKSILDDFINAGRVEDKKAVVTPTNTVGGAAAGKVTYQSLVSSILKTDCILCHNGTNAKIPDLSSYAGAKAEGVNLALSLQDSSTHKQLIIPREIYVKVLEQWGKDGFLEGSAADEIKKADEPSLPVDSVQQVPSAVSNVVPISDPCASVGGNATSKLEPAPGTTQTSTQSLGVGTTDGTSTPNP